MDPSPRWDAAAYEEGSSFQTDEGHRLIADLGDVGGRTVLDVGCGDGRQLAALAEAGTRVLGVDPAWSMVERARSRGVAAVVGRAEALPVRSSSCDVAFSNAALHWSLDHEAVMDELARVLQTAGRLHLRLGGPGNQWGTFLEAERLFTELPYSPHRPSRFRPPLRMGEPTEWFVGLTERGMVVQHIDVEAVDPQWPDPEAMARWFLPIAHPYTAHLPPALCSRFVEEVVRRAWARDRSARVFVRLVVQASKGV